MCRAMNHLSLPSRSIYNDKGRTIGGLLIETEVYRNVSTVDPSQTEVYRKVRGVYGGFHTGV